MSLRRKVPIILLLLAYSLGILLLGNYLASRPITIDSTVGDVQIKFAASRFMVLPGGCATLSWSVSGARQLYLNNEEIIQTGTRELCPTTTSHQVLRIVGNDGKTSEISIFVRVFLATENTRIAAIAGLVSLVLLAGLITLLGDLPKLISKPVGSIRNRILTVILERFPTARYLFIPRDITYITLLIGALGFPLIVLRQRNFMVHIAALMGCLAIMVFWLRPYSGRKNNISVASETASRTRPGFRWILTVSSVLLICTIVCFYWPMKSQFWMGGDEIRVLTDGAEGIGAMSRYDAIFNRPLTPLGSILAVQLAPTIDGFLWIAAAERLLTAVLLFSLIRLSLKADLLALACALLFIVNPSEPTRFLAVYMQGYNMAVLLAVAALALYFQSFRRRSHVLLLVACALLGSALMIVEVIFLFALVGPAILLFAKHNRRDIATWFYAWIATLALFAVRFIVFQRLTSSSYQESVVGTSLTLQSLVGHILQQLRPTFSYLFIPSTSVSDWLPGGIALTIGIGGMMLLRRSRDINSWKPFLVIGGAFIVIALSVAPYITIDGILSTFRTQFVAAPAQAVLWTMLLWLISKLAPKPMRSTVLAGLTGLLIMTSTVNALHTQTTRNINTNVTYQRTQKIVRQILAIAPQVLPNTAVLYFFSGDTPFGWAYYLHGLSLYMLGVETVQINYTDSLGIKDSLSANGFQAKYFDINLYKYSQLIVFEIGPDGQVQLLRKLPQTILPAGPTQADQYNPDARIIPGPPTSLRFF